MAYQIGTATNASGSFSLAHYNLLETIKLFLEANGSFGATVPSSGNVGNGTLTKTKVYPVCPTETWTLTCTGTASDGGTFSVTGSVSGAKAAATVGVPYDNGLVSFTINDGTIDWAVGDDLTFTVTQTALAAEGGNWQILRYNTSGTNHELIVKGPGLSGTEEVFCGIRTYHDVGADYYNLLVMTATGYLSGNTFDMQPGIKYHGVCTHNLNIQYWLAANGQRIVAGLKVGTPVYEHFYIGKFLPYGRPSQYPYPVCTIGMLNAANATRYSDITHSMGYKGSTQPAVRSSFRDPGGVWQTLWVWPWTYKQTQFPAGAVEHIRDTSDYYDLLPLEVYKEAASSATDIYGALDGVYYISGFNNVTENTVVIGGVTYVVLQDVTRTGFADYIAMKLA